MKAFATALATWGACRAARWYLDRTERRDTEYLRGHVRLTALWNHGAAFGLPIGGKCLQALSVGALTVLLTRKRKHPLAVGLILGGGASNLQERLQQGKVYDYVRLPKAPGVLKRYVYNLADFAVFLGGLGLLLAEKDRD